MCLGWGCVPGDWGVGPCMASVPVCFNAGMSPSPLCTNTKSRCVGGKVVSSFSLQHLPISCPSYIASSVSPLFSFLFFRTTRLLVSPFFHLFFVSWKINIPFSFPLSSGHSLMTELHYLFLLWLTTYFICLLSWRLVNTLYFFFSICVNKLFKKWSWPAAVDV